MHNWHIKLSFSRLFTCFCSWIFFLLVSMTQITHQHILVMQVFRLDDLSHTETIWIYGRRLVTTAGDDAPVALSSYTVCARRATQVNFNIPNRCCAATEPTCETVSKRYTDLLSRLAIASPHSAYGFFGGPITRQGQQQQQQQQRPSTIIIKRNNNAKQSTVAFDAQYAVPHSNALGLASQWRAI